MFTWNLNFEHKDEKWKDKTPINEYVPVGTEKLEQLKTPGSISQGTFLFRFK